MARLTPENYQVIEAHEPESSDAITDTSDAIKLSNANGCMIIMHEDYAVDNNEITWVINEGATAAEAAAGTHVLAATFPIWVNLTCQTADTLVRQPDAANYTVPAGAVAGDNIMIIFYIDAAILSAGREWIHIEASVGDVGNYASVLYILDGMRYKQETPLTAIV